MALGGALLGLTGALRWLLSGVDDIARAHSENRAVQVALKCVGCCMWCYQRCIRCLTRFAYVYIAAEGYSFCHASVKTFALVSKHPLQMITNDATRSVLSLLSTVPMPLVCAELAYFATLQRWRAAWTAGDSPSSSAFSAAALPRLPSDWRLADWEQSGAPQELTIAIATLLVALWITSAFRRIYAATVDTLFLCMFLDDFFQPGQYQERPSSAQ